MDWQEELLTCAEHPLWFIDHHVSIYDASERGWIPFRLWPEQVEVLDAVHDNQLTLVLKARQLGLTWLVLGYALWLMIFRPKATVLLFSKREEEAQSLLGDERLRGMYARLPAALKPRTRAQKNAAETWALANGSVARALPSNAGDGYTARAKPATNNGPRMPSDRREAFLMEAVPFDSCLLSLRVCSLGPAGKRQGRFPHRALLVELLRRLE
jgi:hypothetical protein